MDAGKTINNHKTYPSIHREKIKNKKGSRGSEIYARTKNRKGSPPKQKNPVIFAYISAPAVGTLPYPANKN